MARCRVYSFGMHPAAEKMFDDSTSAQEGYGQTFRAAALAWLNAAADAAALNEELGAGSLNCPPQVPFMRACPMRTWQYAIELFSDQSFLERLKSLFQAARTCTPPYEFWVTQNHFHEIAGCFDREVTAYLKVDRVNRRITVLEFENLPIPGVQ